MIEPIDVAALRVDGQAFPVSDADVDALEAELGVTMPPGYRVYVTTLGAGTLDVLLRVLTPDQIRAGLDDHRGLMSANWLWGDGVNGFGQEEATGSIPVASTLDGDVVAFWPD